MRLPLCDGGSTARRSISRRGVVFLLFGLLAAGCSTKESSSDVLVLRGSNTFGEELAPRLFAEYRKDHPGVTFDSEFKGTPYGLGALMAGRCDIAAASRPLNQNDEALAKDRNIDLNDYVIGSYSVAVIVNANNPISNLTRANVRDIFTGAVKNFETVGGPSGPVHLYIRDPISGTYLGFREVAMENKPYALEVKTFTNYEDIAKAVAKDPQGVGYASIELAMKGGGVKGVSIGGAAPTVVTVEQSKYPYARSLRLYTDKAHESSAAHDFIEFVLSKPGQQVLVEMGYVPKS
ncbi:MAG TPA: PstS family phosphate ABC transporter substrate-binding protein [Verrucomicrobiae bacterium]|nr:PstS family phosphate ABC transporter substrate-binding protein [Verrucomicrobiae bacterium]